MDDCIHRVVEPQRESSQEEWVERLLLDEKQDRFVWFD